MKQAIRPEWFKSDEASRQTNKVLTPVALRPWRRTMAQFAIARAKPAKKPASMVYRVDSRGDVLPFDDVTLVVLKRNAE